MKRVVWYFEEVGVVLWMTHFILLMTHFICILFYLWFISARVTQLLRERNAKGEQEVVGVEYETPDGLHRELGSVVVATGMVL